MAGTQYYFQTKKTGPEKGPYSLDEVHRLVQSGKLKKTHFVRRNNSADWMVAGDSLVKVFDQIESLRSRELRQIRAQRVAEQLEQVAVLQSEEHSQPADNSVKKQPVILPAVRSVAGNFRGTIFQKLFSGIRPNSYWGFQVQGYVINIAIGLVLAGALFGCLFSLVLAVMALFNGAGFGGKLMAFGLLLIQSVGALITGFFSVAMLIFFRSVIDWMIDMDSHMHALCNNSEQERNP